MNNVCATYTQHWSNVQNYFEHVLSVFPSISDVLRTYDTLVTQRLFVLHTVNMLYICCTYIVHTLHIHPTFPFFMVKVQHVTTFESFFLFVSHNCEPLTSTVSLNIQLAVYFNIPCKKRQPDNSTPESNFRSSRCDYSPRCQHGVKQPPLTNQYHSR